MCRPFPRSPDSKPTLYAQETFHASVPEASEERIGCISLRAAGEMYMCSCLVPYVPADDCEAFNSQVLPSNSPHLKNPYMTAPIYKRNGVAIMARESKPLVALLLRRVRAQSAPGAAWRGQPPLLTGGTAGKAIPDFLFANQPVQKSDSGSEEGGNDPPLPSLGS